jgi:hypothetical protein
VGKYINDNQLLGALGENFIKDVVLRMGHVFNCIQIDSGLDGNIELRDPATGEMLNLLLRVQVKSTTRFQSDTADGFSFTCDARDIEYWLKGNTPNILVVCNPKERVAYWKSIRDYFATPERRKTRTVGFSKSEDTFNESASGRLFDLARPTDSGLYMEAPRQSELLTTNLLPVITRPQTIYIAPTECKSIKEVYARAQDQGGELPPEIILTDKTLISVHDFREDPVWRHVCEQSASEQFQFDERFDPHETAARSQIAEFLYRCLQGFAKSEGLRYRHTDRVFYVPYVKHDNSAQLRMFHSSRRDSSRTQARGLVIPLGGAAIGYKHCAFHAEFVCADGHWYMHVSPTYFYTANGWKKKHNADEFLSKMKRLEKNKAVFSQLRLWEQYLCDAGKADLVRCAYPHLAFGHLECVRIDRAVPDDLWRRENAAGEDDSAEDLLR